MRLFRREFFGKKTAPSEPEAGNPENPAISYEQANLTARDAINHIIEDLRRKQSAQSPPTGENVPQEYDSLPPPTKLEYRGTFYQNTQFRKLKRMMSDEVFGAQTFEDQETKAEYLRNGAKQLSNSGQLSEEQANFIVDYIESFHASVCSQLQRKNDLGKSITPDASDNPEPFGYRRER